MKALLDVRDLAVTFPIHSPILRRRIGSIYAVRGATFHIGLGETLAIVGESGSGKSTIARAIGRLIPSSGSVLLGGMDLARCSRGELRRARRNLQYVFQDPYSSLNRSWTVERSIAEPLRVFGVGSRTEQREKVAELLVRVGLDPEFAGRRPRALSGGQRQRVAIARALALEPKLVILDEAISALDVSVQAQILNLLARLRDDMGLSYLFITHDLAVVRRLADRVAVMHAGRIVEQAPAGQMFEAPLHPYTASLLSAVPRLGNDDRGRQGRMRLTGGPPSPQSTPPGCLFADRCPVALDRCRVDAPDLTDTVGSRQVACHRVTAGVARWRDDKIANETDGATQ